MRLPATLVVLRRRDFRLVFAASTVSLLGDGVVPVALAFAVLDLTGSATDLGLVLAARTVALLVGLLAGGVLADRIGRRGVMVGADLVRVAGQAAIGGLLVSGHATVPELVVSQIVLGAGTGFFNPASSGLLPAVAGRHLHEGNALRGIAGAASSLAGPAIAGVLVVATGPGTALLLDAGSYAVSALLLLRVGGGANSSTAAATEAPTRSPREPFWAELRGGYAEIRSRTWVWSSLAVLGPVNAVAAAFPVLGALVARRDLGGAGAWAAILAARALGSLLGASALLRFAPRRPLVVALLACTTSALPTILLGIPAPLAVLIAAAVLAGIGPTIFNALWETTLLTHIPERARSRVSAVDWFASLAAQPAGYALVGPLAAGIGLAPTLFGAGALELLLTAGLLAVPDVRRLGPEPVGSPAT